MAGEAVKVEVESLHDFLTDNESNIDYVCLTWIWEETATLESNYIGRVNGYIQPLYHEFVYDRIDLDYSFVGTIEDAKVFADQYDCWDMRELNYEDGIVTGEIREEGTKDNDIKDINRYGIDISYIGLVYYYNDLRGNSKTAYYNGEPERKKKLKKI